MRKRNKTFLRDWFLAFTFMMLSLGLGEVSAEEYTITWLDHNGNYLRHEVRSVEETLTCPTQRGIMNTPTKDLGCWYWDYRFIGWNTSQYAGWAMPLGQIYSDQTYYAQFEEFVKSYTITWLNHNGSYLWDENRNAGSAPTCPVGIFIDTPTKQRHNFIGWTPELSQVTGNQTYTAVFEPRPLPEIPNVLWQFQAATSITMSTWDSNVEYSLWNLQYFSGWNGWDWYGYWDWAEMRGWQNSGVFDNLSPGTEYQVRFRFRETETDFAGEIGTISVKTMAQHSITWRNWDNNLLSNGIHNNPEPYEAGQTPSFKGNTPTRESTWQYNYIFAGWRRDSDFRIYRTWESLPQVFNNETYSAIFDSTPINYVITWRNWNNNLLDTENYNAGQMPSFKGNTPTRPSTLTHSFTFIGWNTAPNTGVTIPLSQIQSNRTYYAVFSQTERPIIPLPYTTNFNLASDVSNWTLHNTTWQSSDGGWLRFVGAGIAVMPLLPANQTNLRVIVSSSWGQDISLQTSFDGDNWNDQGRLGGAAGRNETIRQIPDGTRLVRFVNHSNFSTGLHSVSITNQPPIPTHTITWANFDGSVISTEIYEEGQMPAFKGSTPAREPNSTHWFEFAGWTPVLSIVLGNQTYTAVFNEIPHPIPTYTITWTNYDGSVIYTDIYEEGQMPVFKGSTPTREATLTQRFEFVGWAPEIAVVSGNQTYTTLFEVISISTKLPQSPPNVEVVSMTRNSITLTEIPNAEYVLICLDRWQESNEFMGLNAGRVYTFGVRLKETETHYASDWAVLSAETHPLDANKDVLTILSVSVDSEKMYDGTRDAIVRNVMLAPITLNALLLHQVSQLRRDVDYIVRGEYNSPNVSEAHYVLVSVELIGDAADRFQFENSSMPTEARIIKKTWENNNAEISLTLDGQRTTAKVPGGTLNLTFFPSTRSLPKIDRPTWLEGAEISWTIIGNNENNFTWRRWNEGVGGGVPAGAGNYYIRVKIPGNENIADFDARIKLVADFQYFEGGGAVRQVAFAQNPVYDKAEIFVETIGYVNIRLTIHDVVGNTIFTTSARADKNSRQPVAVWSLTNRAGIRVSSGTYIVIVEAQDEYGQIYRFVERLGVATRN